LVADIYFGQDFKALKPCFWLQTNIIIFFGQALLLINLKKVGYSHIEVHNETISEATKAGVSHEEFNRCLASLEGKVTQE
jgi:hypothetical protein